ncbi:MAG: zinc transport system substrate-binding protein [Patescibacteria group bacterium]|jgi:zinc transport system substrate-binding protein|nr:zinc transport system substrate-binding protein [Patescibacteria group bacterium]
MGRYIVGALGLIVLFIIGGLILLDEKVTTRESDGDLVVSTTFYPIAEFTRQVGGDFIHVVTVTPAGTEPHEYEPTPLQIAALYDADMFIYNGGGIDGWAEQVAPELEKEHVPVVNISTTMQTLPLADGSEIESDFDPHFWLDPVLAQQEIVIIRDALSELDPEHADVYAANAEIYMGKLAELHRDYVAGLANDICIQDTVITSHAAFAYLGDRYSLSILPISGLSPEAEPSIARMTEIINLVKEKGVKYIFVETLVSPEASETIAKETGGGTLIFNPLEGLTSEELAAGDDYITVMRQNLENLRLGLECR